MLSFRIEAISWDTQRRLPYNPDCIPMIPRTPKIITKRTPDRPQITWESLAIKLEQVLQNVLNPIIQGGEQVKQQESYMGFERWLPRAPKMEKSRSAFTSGTLAYIGDCVFELYARRHFLFPPISIKVCRERVAAVVHHEAQVKLLEKLLKGDFLTEKERRMALRGNNNTEHMNQNGSGYTSANTSGLEILVGYLFLTNAKRLEEVMAHLGFASGSSSRPILEEDSSWWWRNREIDLFSPPRTEAKVQVK